MDRIEFVQSIDYENFEKSIVRFFDENMALYNLVGEYKNIGCITGNVDGSSITFDLTFNNKKDSKKMQAIIKDKVVCIFECKYSIESIVSNKTLNIKLLNMNEGCSGCL